jgi:hypothetical protein
MLTAMTESAAARHGERSTVPGAGLGHRFCSAANGTDRPPRFRSKLIRSTWIKELPFTLVLILTIGGVAYTSFSKKPIVGYWEIFSRPSSGWCASPPDGIAPMTRPRDYG